MRREGGKLSVAVLLLSGLLTLPCVAQTSPDIAFSEPSFKNHLFSRFEPRVSGDLRLRYQHLQRDDFADDGQALTLRFQGALEAKISEKTYILGEIEGVKAVVEDFNDGTGRRPQFPFIPDPEGLELNRLQIITEANNDNGKFSGDSYFLNYNLATPFGRFAAFHYALDLETGTDSLPQYASSQTTGARILGRRDWDVFAKYDFGALGPFSNVESFARHHWFEADTTGRNYGRELNLSLKAKLHKTGFALEYANYKAETFSVDTQAFFLTSEISF